jgi:signal transduction histidine kinase
LALVDLRALLQRMCVNHRAMARVPLLWDVDGSVPRLVITDPLRVQQIVANGVTNSCKHTARGHIRVSAHVEGAGVGRTLVVVVEDTGPGLSKPAEALFEPFVTGRGVPAGLRRASSPVSRAVLAVLGGVERRVGQFVNDTV